MNIPTIQTFSFTPTGQPQEARRLRAHNIDGAPWFVLRDVMHCVGGKCGRDGESGGNGRRTLALKKRGQLGEVFFKGPLRTQVVHTTTLAGLKGVLDRSHLPAVEEFRAWVRVEVLPKLTAKVVPAPAPTPAAAVPMPAPTSTSKRSSLDAELKTFDAKVAVMRDACELAWYRKQTAQVTE